MTQKLFFLLFVSAAHFVVAQKITHKIPDSLKRKNYTYLDDKIYELREDSTKAAVYLFTYLNKAKNEQNWKEIINGYQNILHQSPDNLRLIYADSMIYTAKKSGDDALMGSAYLSKGIVFYGKKQMQNALDNYIIANNHISRTNDNYLIYKAKYNIAMIKSYLGYYDEAISLFKECVEYFKEENTRPYLNSLHSLGICYNKTGDYGQCSLTNALGLSESIRLENQEMNPYFIHSEGVNQYFKENYGVAIKKIESSLESIVKNKDFASESIGNFYIGKCYWKLQKQEKAIPYFLRVDQIYQEKNYIRPDIRQAYELLITYYRSTNNLESLLYCIDQLLKADTFLNETYVYLVSKMHKEYNTSELLFEKEKIKGQLIKEKQYDIVYIGVILVSFVTISVLTYRHLKNRKQYRQKYEELMRKINNGNLKAKSDKLPILDINPETVAIILNQLEKFEKDLKFLEKNLTLVKLASRFNSNVKYLSIIISHHKEKSFSRYINDLKIDYLITLLKTDKKIRKYNNAALAEEVGFTSTQRFANAFQARAEMPTGYFIKQIKKENG